MSQVQEVGVGARDGFVRSIVEGAGVVLEVEGGGFGLDVVVEEEALGVGFVDVGMGGIGFFCFCSAFRRESSVAAISEALVLPTGPLRLPAGFSLLGSM